MAKFFALLLAIVGFVMFGIGLALTREYPFMLAVGMSGAGLTYFAFSLDLRREKLAEAQRGREIKLRIEALTRIPWKAESLLEIKGGASKVLLVLLMLAASSWFVYASVSETGLKWGMFLGSAIAFLLVLFALIRLLYGLGKPALLLGIHGFQTPLQGFVAWHEVGGVNLHQIKTRGGTSHFVIFQVENYGHVVPRIHWTERVLAGMGLGVLKRKVILVSLNGASEEPEVVYAVARHLWQQRTRMNHEWNPQRSKAFNQAARRVDEFIDRYRDPAASAAGMLEDPGRALKELEQFRQDMASMNSERRRSMSKLNWLLLISLLGMVAAIVFGAFIKPHV